MIEGAAETTKPLKIEVVNGSGVIATIEFPISISGVEDMYRHLNLRGELGGTGGIPTDLDEPSNYPDNLSNGKNFIFVHGYNVNGEAARGWNSEMFKRLHRSGSKAKFTAVTWRGEEGQILGSATPDYWENVFNAFKTSEPLTNSLEPLLTGETTIAAHSLGNMVVSSAIKDFSLAADHYIMLDAAVALEAYSALNDDRDLMRHPQMAPYVDDPLQPKPYRLWSIEWHDFFPSSDNRNKLTWRNRFGNITSAFNFFSTGEEVLKDGEGTLPTTIVTRAWVTQEMKKGTPNNPIASDFNGGWGFNTFYNTGSLEMQPAQALLLTDAELMANSFFTPFADSDLYDPAQGSQAAEDHEAQGKILGEAIPSLSFATGANELDIFGELRNEDMMNLKPNGWPSSRGNGDWLHSDIREVAYLYTFEVFDQIVGLGGLNQ